MGPGHLSSGEQHKVRHVQSFESFVVETKIADCKIAYDYQTMHS